MAYGDVKDLTKRTTSDKILRDKASDVRYHDLASMIYNFFDKKLLVEQLKTKICQTKN